MNTKNIATPVHVWMKTSKRFLCRTFSQKDLGL